jgi:hypothetical protein
MWTTFFVLYSAGSPSHLRQVSKLGGNGFESQCFEFLPKALVIRNSGAGTPVIFKFLILILDWTCYFNLLGRSVTPWNYITWNGEFSNSSNKSAYGSLGC